MTSSAKFWNKLALRYSKQPIANEAAYQKKLEITRGYLGPDTEVLEIGCGTGSTALLHAPLVKHLHAIDFSSAMIDIAKAKAADEKIENVAFEVCAIDDLNTPEQSLDVVLAMSVLHLMEDRDAVITKVHRLLKPGGVFITSTVCLTGFWNIFKVVGPVGRFFGLLPILKNLSAQDIRESFLRAGFEIDHQWQPEKSKAVFMVAKKAETSP